MIYATSPTATGPPLLLLNGIAMSAASWQPVAAPLTEHFTVIRCDLRGQLMSPGTPPADVADHVNDVLEVLDDLGLDSVHVLATSFGGAVGALLAARSSRAGALAAHHRLGRRLHRCHGHRGRALAGGSRAIARGRRSRRPLRCPRTGGLLTCICRGPPRRAGSAAAADRGAARHSGSRIWWVCSIPPSLSACGPSSGAIRCPTLVVAAELDGFIPLERCRALAEAIPGAEFKVIQDAGHAVVVEQPETIVALALEFFGAAI